MAHASHGPQRLEARHLLGFPNGISLDVQQHLRALALGLVPLLPALEDLTGNIIGI